MRQVLGFLALFGLVALFGRVVLLFGYLVSGTGAGKRVGSAASGAMYDLLNEDKRKAVDIIVENRAAATDPETRDGNLPDLIEPKQTDGP